MESNKQEQKTYSREEILKGLTEAVELQKLQTELQELKTRMWTAKANEVFAIGKINEVMASEQEIEQKEGETAQKLEPNAEATK